MKEYHYQGKCDSKILAYFGISTIILAVVVGLLTYFIEGWIGIHLMILSPLIQTYVLSMAVMYFFNKYQLDKKSLTVVAIIAGIILFLTPFVTTFNMLSESYPGLTVTEFIKVSAEAGFEMTRYGHSNQVAGFGFYLFTGIDFIIFLGLAYYFIVHSFVAPFSSDGKRYEELWKLEITRKNSKELIQSVHDFSRFKKALKECKQGRWSEVSLYKLPDYEKYIIKIDSKFFELESGQGKELLSLEA